MKATNLLMLGASEASLEARRVFGAFWSFEALPRGAPQDEGSGV
jgi:hypothetical protein